MLSGTVLNDATISSISGSWIMSSGITAPWPIKRVHMTATPYNVMARNTNTQNIAWSASNTPCASSYRGRMRRTRRSNRTVRSRRQMSTAMKSQRMSPSRLIKPLYANAGTTHCWKTPTPTTTKSKMSHKYSSSPKKCLPLRTKRTDISTQKKHNKACSTQKYSYVLALVSRPTTMALSEIIVPHKILNQVELTQSQPLLCALFCSWSIFTAKSGDVRCRTRSSCSGMSRFHRASATSWFKSVAANSKAMSSCGSGA
mmetsp:Transcript_92096/g.281882  ORF Transcript_92096/g.281882 Transcript_92096/m.281882 type:complete len:257 (+) Transcript_92096:527-1297(+)